MGKRTNNQSGKATNKKAKVDPILVSISNVINQSESLPARVRAMLVDMLPFSLSVPSDKRHDAQTWAVGAVGQTLQAHKSALEAALATENEKLTALQASESGLTGKVTDAEAEVLLSIQRVQSAKTALAEATEAANAAKSSFAAAQTEQAAGDARLAQAQEDKTALEAALEAHFTTPMQQGESVHFKELQPFLKQIDLEASFLKALPSSCAKSKEDRGSFDEVVLKELEKALVSKVAALGEVLAVETPAAAQRADAVQAAEVEQSAKIEAQRQLVEAFESAQKEQSDRESIVAEAKKAVQEFQPQVDEITSLVESAKTALDDFETGALAGFTTYKDRVETSPEAAPAGA